MAVTGLHPVKKTPQKALAYVARPEKSEDGTLIFSGSCSTEWRLAHLQMQQLRRRFGKDSQILLHHGYVSFPKNEVTKEEALEFAKEWMQRNFSEFQYFGSVHVDAEHIHFNYIVNAVSNEGRKYYGNKTTLAELRAETDRLCEERNLSVVIPKNKGMSYKEWMEQGKKSSWKQQAREDIDAAIDSVATWEDFLKTMRENGYWVKEGANVKHILFKAPGQARGCRGKTLGKNYTEDAIKDRIRFREFHFNPGKIRMRRVDKFHTPLQHELRRLAYRRPGLDVALALAIHMIAGTKKIPYRRKNPSGTNQRKKTIAKTEIEKLSRQLFFVQEKEFHTRTEILSYRDQAPVEEQKRCDELLEALDSIRYGNWREQLAPDREIENSEEEKGRKEDARSWGGRS